MVSLEFEKPSNWSIGKKLGIIAVIFLIIGPFLPYITYEVYSYLDSGTETRNQAYFDYEDFGLWMLLPLITAIFMMLLLYLKADIYLEKGTKKMNIKPFILMAWGFWFFLTYLTEATRYGDLSSSIYPGYGLWMIVIGFLLCTLVGFLEWRYPSMAGPKIAFGRKVKTEPAAQQASVPSAPQQTPVTVTEVKPYMAPEATVKETPKPEPKIEPEPTPVIPAEPKKIEEVKREPASEEEKTLLRWARHINEEGKTFEQCMKCNNYVFITAADTGSAIDFKCPECNASFTLNK